MENKTLICGAASKVIEEFLLDWIISLRTLGRYDGEIIVLDYGVSKTISEKCQLLGAKVIKCMLRVEEVTGVARYIDLIPFLNEYEDYNIAIMDTDIWFQNDMNGLWPMIDLSHGCLMSCEKIPLDYLNKKIYRGPQQPRIKDIERERNAKLIKMYGGTINAGLLAGRVIQIRKKLLGFRECLADMFIIGNWCAEQFYLNYFFDFDNDRGDAYEWNCVVRDCYFRDGKYYMRNRMKEVEVIGVHCFRYKTDDRTKHMFRTIHKVAYNRAMKEINSRYEKRSANGGDNPC